MAKMFYTLEEAAQKLGKDEQAIKDMAAAGELQQFRDRDRLMFKRDQVDALSGGGEEPEISLEDSAVLDSSDASSGILELADDTSAGAGDDPREATGISVFDAGEIETADPAAQTQVEGGAGEELDLDSVGSGSGLLDLTREADDTSLGMELDEIYPGGSTAGTAATSDTAAGLSSAFDTSAGDDTGVGMAAAATEAPSELAAPEDELAVPDDDEIAMPMGSTAVEPSDPAGSGLGVGLMIGALAAMILAAIVTLGAIGGGSTGLLALMTGDPGSLVLWFWVGGLAVASLIFGVIGYVVGNAMG